MTLPLSELSTARHIMQYLEDAYGIIGPSHLEYVTTNLLQWDPTQPARLNFVCLEEFWDVLQYNYRNRFMSLQSILNSHPSVLAIYNKFISDNPLSTNYDQLRVYMTQRLPMGTHAVVNSISTSPDITHMQIAHLTSSLETIHLQQQEIQQRLAELQQIQSKPQQ